MKFTFLKFTFLKFTEVHRTLVIEHLRYHARLYLISLHEQRQQAGLPVLR